MEDVFGTPAINDGEANAEPAELDSNHDNFTEDEEIETSRELTSSDSDEEEDDETLIVIVEEPSSEPAVKKAAKKKSPAKKSPKNTSPILIR